MKRTRNYVYTFGDATRAYQSTLYTSLGNDPKISDFTGNLFIWNLPDGTTDYFCIFDRVIETTTNYAKNSPNSSKRWVLHSKYWPTVDGTQTVVRDGKWSYADGSYVISIDTETFAVEGSASVTAGGKLFSKTLLPDNF